MIRKSQSWSLCETATKNVGEPGFLSCGFAGDQKARRAPGVSTRTLCPNQSRQISQIRFETLPDRLLPFSFILFTFCFSPVVRGSNLLSPILTFFPSQPVEITNSNIHFPDWRLPFRETHFSISHSISWLSCRVNLTFRPRFSLRPPCPPRTLCYSPFVPRSSCVPPNRMQKPQIFLFIPPTEKNFGCQNVRSSALIRPLRSSS